MISPKRRQEISLGAMGTAGVVGLVGGAQSRSSMASTTAGSMTSIVVVARLGVLHAQPHQLTVGVGQRGPIGDVEVGQRRHREDLGGRSVDVDRVVGSELGRPGRSGLVALDMTLGDRHHHHAGGRPCSGRGRRHRHRGADAPTSPRPRRRRGRGWSSAPARRGRPAPPAGSAGDRSARPWRRVVVRATGRRARVASMVAAPPPSPPWSTPVAGGTTVRRCWTSRRPTSRCWPAWLAGGTGGRRRRDRRRCRSRRGGRGDLGRCRSRRHHHGQHRHEQQPDGRGRHDHHVVATAAWARARRGRPRTDDARGARVVAVEPRSRRGSVASTVAAVWSPGQRARGTDSLAVRRYDAARGVPDARRRLVGSHRR